MSETERRGRDAGAGRPARRLAAAALVAAVALFLVRGCAFMPWNSSAPGIPVRVTVTRGFGKEVLRDGEVELKGSPDAMQALQAAAEVETSYGGGFIQSVDGLASDYGRGIAGSGGKNDWFFYANGQLAEVGAASYRLRRGDHLVFDYHGWGYSLFTPALAGCFPASFLRGYGGIPEGRAVVYAPGWEGQAEEIALLLEEAGAGPCEARRLEEGWAPEDGEYAVVLGSWPQLEGVPALAAANRDASRLGLYAFFRPGELVILDGQGREAGAYSNGAGLVTCTGPLLGRAGAVLMVTGTDPEGVEEALRLLKEAAGGGSPPVLALAGLAGGGPLTVPGGGE